MNRPQSRVALFRWLPRLAARVPWVELGDWPTPLDAIEIDGRTIWVKREGESSRRYGGNKVRTLEAWLGHLRASGAQRIWAMGAYGSNHVIATVLHARALGLEAGAIVFPQPASEWAIENAAALIGTGCPIIRLRTVIEVPFAGLAVAAGDWSVAALRRNLGDDIASWSGATLGRLLGIDLGTRSIVMPPGGATPLGTLGALSAAFELAEQIAARAAPPPRRIVLPIGSTCTTAGLVAGFALAHAIGAWRWPVPVVHGVRVTPWPVTSRTLIVRLAKRTLARIASLGGPTISLPDPQLVVDGRELGGGYGVVTPRGEAAMRVLAPRRASANGSAHATPETGEAPRLDGVYSAKAAAALLRLHRQGIGPLVFWATKSSVLLPAPQRSALDAAPAALVRWLQ
jgi:D-cysteine desulfhydrase